jgi:hypothetical protein
MLHRNPIRKQPKLAMADVEVIEMSASDDHNSNLFN